MTNFINGYQSIAWQNQRIHVNTWCNGGIYDASTGKITVTMWLEKKV